MCVSCEECGEEETRKAERRYWWWGYGNRGLPDSIQRFNSRSVRCSSVYTYVRDGICTCACMRVCVCLYCVQRCVSMLTLTVILAAPMWKRGADCCLHVIGVGVECTHVRC